MITSESASKQTLDKREHKMVDISQISYWHAIGSLLYLSNGTRPDITYAVNVLSRKQSNYDNENRQKMKRVLKYLRETKNLG